jgi:hypothetical protein
MQDMVLEMARAVERVGQAAGAPSETSALAGLGGGGTGLGAQLQQEAAATDAAVVLLEAEARQFKLDLGHLRESLEETLHDIRQADTRAELLMATAHRAAADNSSPRLRVEEVASRLQSLNARSGACADADRRWCG